MLERVHTAQRLAEGGRFAALVDMLAGEAERALGGSPTLAWLYGLGLARLGRHDAGQRWVATALALARARGDRTVEVRALNVLGGIALEQGAVAQADAHFRVALAEAERAGDHATMGRCSTNLGIIANLRGDFETAIGAYTLAIAAFQRAALPWGVVVAHHNLGIAYREQGLLDRARDEADQAVEGAARTRDRSLAAQVTAGRAEIRLAAGDAAGARLEVTRALHAHEILDDVVGAAEDRRILANTEAALGRAKDAERLLHRVAEEAREHGRPLLAATARRDLAGLLRGLSRLEEARDQARAARVAFSALGAAAEVRRLDAVIAGLGPR